MYTYFNKHTHQVNLSWSQAVYLAVKEATQEHNKAQETKLYMYNPVGSEPIPLEELESVLMDAGAARIAAGHQIHLILTSNGKQTWTGVIDKDFMN